MASGYSKCSCCQWRYATFNARYNRGGRIVAKYCEQCKGGHARSPQGWTLIYDRQSYMNVPTDPNPRPHQYTYDIFGQRYSIDEYFKCWCCEYNYKKSAVVRLNYECGRHSIIVCIRCGWKHQTCPYKDSDKITQESVIKFYEKVENSSDDKPYQ